MPLKTEVLAHKVYILKWGTSKGIYLDTKFVDELKIRNYDFVIPCIINSQELMDNDPVLGKKELIFRFRRKKGDSVFDYQTQGEINADSE